MIIKVCQFRARRDQGERLVEVFRPGEIEKAAAFFAMGKTAQPMLPEVQQFLQHLMPDPSKIYVLVNALGAGEYWGSNINGDYFPEGSLIHRGPIYGYETFYQAHPYKHHVNKDPSRSFGEVKISAWHDEMKRVELVVCIDRELAAKFGAQDICDKLDHGLFPDVSMGCKVPYDLCSKCTDWAKYRDAQSTYDPSLHQSVGQAVLVFHRRNPIRGLSVTRNDYCEHLKTQLNKILSDGTKIYAINDFPRFFDISFVFIGADKTAKVMAKLAHVTLGYHSEVVPSWHLAEELGYQPEIEKDFEKVAAVPVRQVLREVVRATGKRYHPEKMSLNRAITMARKGVAKSEMPEEKQAGLDLVRARLREKKASHHKGAEITKEVVPSQFGGKAVPTEHSTPDLPNEILDQLGKCPLHEALSTPTSMGMLLRPREFQRITIISLGRKDLADQMDRDSMVIPQSGERDTTVPMGPEHFSDIIKRLLMPFLEGRSMLEPIAKRRMIPTSIGGEGEPPELHKEPWGNTLKVEKLKTAESPFLCKIAAAYNGYLDRAVDCLKQAADIVSSHSDLWETVFREGLATGFEKNAAGAKVNPAVLLGAIGGGYALSEYARWQRERARMGVQEPVGPITNFAAEYPKLLMFLAGMGALHQQGSTIPRRIVQGIAGFADKPDV